MKLKLVLSVFCLLIFLLAISCSSDRRSGNAANNSTLANATPAASQNANVASAHDDLATGRDLYVKHCADCHKESGEGGPTVVDGRKMKPDNLTDDRREKLSDDKYLKFMVDGIEDEGMPSFKDKMSEAEMREVVRYIRVGLQKQDPGSVTATKPTTK